MNEIKAHLEKARKISREKHHLILHKIHKKYKISKQTLFYIKEYGPHSHVPNTILKESIQILLVAAIITAAGGMALEKIKELFVAIIPLVVLLPVLNDTIGGYGSIISSRFSTMLYEGKRVEKWWKSRELKKLFFQVLIISMLTTSLSAVIALIFSLFSNYEVTFIGALKIMLITMVDALLLILIMFISSICIGLHYYWKKEDPNNFMIPIITSIADFGNMIILAILVVWFF